MPTNPYFRHLQHDGESFLFEDLIIESIEQFGLDTYYLPREFQNEDLILGEDTLAKFSKLYQMEMYIEVFDRFSGQGDFIQKFGIEIDDTATIVVSIRTFTQMTKGEMSRPKEGDLIFFPLHQKLFEITFVEHEPTFYQLGRQYVFEMKTRLFTFNNQDIATGLPEIDSYMQNLEYTIDITLGTGSGTFQIGEMVFQGLTFASAVSKAEVVGYDSVAKKLVLRNINGEFQIGNGNIKGETSLASWTYVSSNTDYQQANAQNSELQTEADLIKTDNDPIFGKF